MFLAFLSALLGGLLRRLWGADDVNKDQIELGWVRQSYTKIGIIVLSLSLAALVDVPLWAVGVLAVLHAMPWWLPWWGESNLNPQGRWSPWLGALVMGGRFLLPAVGIAWVAEGVWAGASHCTSSQVHLVFAIPHSFAT